MLGLKGWKTAGCSSRGELQDFGVLKPGWLQEAERRLCVLRSWKSQGLDGSLGRCSPSLCSSRHGSGWEHQPPVWDRRVQSWGPEGAAIAGTAMGTRSLLTLWIPNQRWPPVHSHPSCPFHACRVLRR